MFILLLPIEFYASFESWIDGYESQLTVSV